MGLLPIWQLRLALARAHYRLGRQDSGDRIVEALFTRHSDRLEVALPAAKIASRRKDCREAVRRWSIVCDLSQSANGDAASDIYRKACWQLATAARAAGRGADTETALRNLASRMKADAANLPRQPSNNGGMCFVLTDAHRGWILEKIARVISKHVPGSRLAYISATGRSTEIPDAPRYFFMHQQILCNALAWEPRFWHAEVSCFHTHPSENAVIQPQHTPLFLNQAHRIFVQNSRTRTLLTKAGVDASRIGLVLGGADPGLFRRHARGAGKLGFVGGYYERKNPALLLELARAMPDEEFLLVGPSLDEINHEAIYWPNAPIFEEIVAQPNLEYREARYDDFPKHFDDIDIYLMLSKLEGGPIPLLEAMMANSIPIATDTGFVPDIITPGQNGYIVPINAPVGKIAELVRLARSNDADIRKTVASYSWENYGREIARMLGEN